MNNLTNPYFDIQPQKVLHVKDELKKKRPKLPEAAIISIKYNGWWVALDYDSSYQRPFSSFISSAGRAIPSLEYYSQELNKHVGNSLLGNYRILAEVISPNMGFYELNGKLNRHNETLENPLFMVHDVLAHSSLPAERRLEIRDMLVKGFSAKVPWFKSAKILEDRASWQVYEPWFNWAIDEGEEGIVIKDIASRYAPGKRNSSLMKMKMNETFDLLCTGYEETFGEKGNPSITLYMQSADGREHKVLLPKQSDQKLLLADSFSFVGKVCEIRAMQRNTDTGGFIQPIFSCIRHDKSPTEID